jgi:hypothetical protein
LTAEEARATRCTVCGEMKPIDAFYFGHGRPMDPCKACRIASATEGRRWYVPLMDLSSAPDWRTMPCEEWTGRLSSTGYGTTSRDGRQVYVHRLTWEECFGDILTRDDVIAHHCDNRVCRQPLHLFKTDIVGNNRDMFAKGRGRTIKRQAHCIRGHSLADAYVGRAKGDAYQRCRMCVRMWNAQRYRGKTDETRTA